jgi:hypothetical protein
MNDSDESTTTSNSSSASVQHRHRSRQRSHHVAGFRSPPPPYTTSEQPHTVFATSSLPPSYESHINENIPIDPSMVTNAQPTENLPLPTTTLDVSATLTNTSIETFHV